MQKEVLFVLIYTVQPGDTLFSIAMRLGSTVDLILAANQIPDPDQIMPGQKLLIPILTGTRVQVQPGDTLFNLALRYDLPVDVIAAANNLQPPFTIFPGQVLQIPLLLPNVNDCIAYLSTRARGTFDIWVRNPGSINPARLTTALAGPASVPAWSPDGGRVAFVGRQGNLWVVNAASRQATILIGGLPEFTPFDWSPDGESIVVSVQNEIILVNAETGATTFITAGSDPVFLPGGEGIVFTRETATGMEQIFLSDLTGGNLRQVTRLTETGNIQNLDVDPFSQLVSFTLSGATTSTVYIASLTTGQITRTPVGEQARDFFPRWSPNGEFLAYNSTMFTEERGFAGIVRVVNRQGELVADLTDTACFGERIAWGPDSQFIVYPNCLTGNLPQLSVVTFNRVPIQITSIGINVHPDWKAGNCPMF